MSQCLQLTEAYVFFYGSGKPVGQIMVNTITGFRTPSLSHSALMRIVVNFTLNCKCEAAFNHWSKHCKPVAPAKTSSSSSWQWTVLHVDFTHLFLCTAAEDALMKTVTFFPFTGFHYIVGKCFFYRIIKVQRTKALIICLVQNTSILMKELNRWRKFKPITTEWQFHNFIQIKQRSFLIEKFH